MRILLPLVMLLASCAMVFGVVIQTYHHMADKQRVIMMEQVKQGLK